MPVKGWANESRILSTNKYDVAILAGNSQDLRAWTLLKIDGNNVVQADPGDDVYAVCKSKIETTADNTTVAKKAVIVRPILQWDTYTFLLPAGATPLTEADVLKFYDFDADHYVDSASGATVQWTLPLQLIKVFQGWLEGEFMFAK